MQLSLPANPIPSELYQYFFGTSSVYIPWITWGGGCFATKYGYDKTKYVAYKGTVSVPLLAGGPVIVKNFRLTGSVNGKSGTTEGAIVVANLCQHTGGGSSTIASIVVDRTAVVVADPNVDITVSAGAFSASPSANTLAIELIGGGQGVATITGFFLELEY
jgi:hypothetical protein